MNHRRHLAPGLAVLLWGSLCLCPQAGGQANPLAPMARSEFELEAYRDIEASAEAAERLGLTESFMARYPESELRHLVLRARWDVLLETRDWAAVRGIAETALAAETDFREKRRAANPGIESEPGYAEGELRHFRYRVAYYQSLAEACSRLGDYRAGIGFAERGLEAEDRVWERVVAGFAAGESAEGDARVAHRSVQSFFLRSLMGAHQRLNNFDQAIRYGRQLLELIPDDLFALMAISNVMAEAAPPDDPAALEARMIEAREYALRALEALSGEADLIPASEQGQLRASVEASLGMIEFRRKQFDPARDHFLRALAARPTDSLLHYRLGVSLVNGGDLEQAMKSLARAVFLEYPGAEALDALIRVYEVVRGDLEGMDAFVEATGRELASN